MHTRLFDILEKIQCVEKEDFQLILSVTRLLTKPTIPEHQQIDSNINCDHEESILESSTITVEFFPSTDLQDDINITQAANYLAKNSEIPNFYTFVDALWCRFWKDLSSPSNRPDVASALIAVKKRRCWGVLDYDYIDRLCYESWFLDRIAKCKMLTSNDVKLGEAIISRWLTAENFVKEFFLQDSSFEFQVSDQKFENQKFVLRTVAMKGKHLETFMMEYGYSNSNEKHEFHLPKLHFCLEVDEGKRYLPYLLPLSWCGKPTCDVTKTYWNWGYIKFHDEDMDELEMVDSKEAGGYSNLNYYFDVMDHACRLIAFVMP